MRETDHADAGGQEEQEPAGGFSAVEAQGEPGQRECGEESSDGAGQTRGSFADAKKLEAEGGSPVVKRWFFKPGLTVKTWCDPITRFLHVAGDRGVARLVGADETDGAQIVEIAKIESREDQREPEEARCG